jgi:hypothetical protein
MPNLRTLTGRLLAPRLRRALIDAEISVARRFEGSRLASVVGPFMLRKYLDHPHELDIEVTSGCDADCIMCPRKQMRRAPGPMPLPLFRTIIDEAVAIGVRDVVLNGYGEISTLRNAREYLSYIRRRSRAIRIIVNTNGMRLSEDLAAAYIEHKVDIVNITIDGATAETFESIRKHLKLETVEANVRRLIEMRNKAGRRPFIMLHMLDMPQNRHEAPLFLQKWTGLADYAGLAGLLSRGGSVESGPARPNWFDTPCFLLWRQMPILSDGSIAMCCDDWDGTMSLGNVADGGIRKAWRSHARNQLRQLHLRREAAQISLCDGCQSPRRPPWWFVARPLPEP